MTTTTRRGDIGQNFEETTTGEQRNSVEISMNAKGQITYTVKMYFSDEDFRGRADRIVKEFTDNLETLYEGRLAGQS